MGKTSWKQIQKWLDEFSLSNKHVAPRFNRNGKKLLVLSNRSGSMQVWEYSFKTKKIKQRTRSPEPIEGAIYSPINDTILYSVSKGGNESHHRFLLKPNGRKTPIPIAKNAIMRNGIFSPDGTKIAFATNERKESDFDVYVYDIRKKTKKCVLQRTLHTSPQCFSPNGKYLISQAFWGNEESEHFLTDLSTNQTTAIWPRTADSNRTMVMWDKNSTGLYFSTNQNAEFIGLKYIRLSSKEEKWVVRTKHDIEMGAISKNRQRMMLVFNENGKSKAIVYRMKDWKPLFHYASGGVINSISMQLDGKRIAIVSENLNQPGKVELFTIPRGKKETLFTNSDINPPMVSRSTHYSSFDGTRIPLDMLSIAGTKKENPVIVWIHGGPHSQQRLIYSPIFHIFARMGYWIALPNIRGSTGYGKHYAEMDNKGKRKNAIRDLAYLHQHLVQKGYNPMKIGLWGGSYGGYMVLAGLAFQPTLWAAGQSRVGFGNLFSFVQNTPPYRRHYRTPEYGDPTKDRKMMRSLSPYFAVNRIRAPLQMIHGKNDTRVPVSESIEMYKKLKKRKRIVELKIYPDEGHQIGKKKNRRDINNRTFRFFQKYLPVE